MKTKLAIFSIVLGSLIYLLSAKVFVQSVVAKAPSGEMVVAMENGFHHLLRQILRPNPAHFRERYTLIEYRNAVGTAIARFAPSWAPNDHVKVGWTDSFVAISSSLTGECPDFRVFHRLTGAIENPLSDSVKALPHDVLKELDPCGFGRAR